MLRREYAILCGLCTGKPDHQISPLSIAKGSASPGALSHSLPSGAARGAGARGQGILTAPRRNIFLSVTENWFLSRKNL